MKHSETRADGSSSEVPAPKRRRFYRVIVELPPRLLGTIVSEPAPGWLPRPAWNAPLTIARLPTLIAGGDFIAGEPTTRGTVPAVETWIYDHDAGAESINRNLEDTLWLGRAHSIGHARQTMNLLGYALMVNGLALHRHRRHRTKVAA